MRNLKIHTAIFICTAFMLRILYINIGIISSYQSKSTHSHKSHVSTLTKRKRQFEISENVKNDNYAVVEICEENDDDDKFKSKPSLLSQYFNALFSGNLKDPLKAHAYKSFSYVSSPRYLTYQVFRI